MSQEGLSVKTITRLVGLNEHTLRAWERRYQAVTPQRQANGRRTYTHQDVERLRFLVQLVERGHPIGKIAQNETPHLRKMLADAYELDGKAVIPDRQQANKEIDAIVQAIMTNLEAFNLAGTNNALQQARLKFGAKSFAIDVIAPLMSQVGRLVLDQKLSIGQEKALVAIVKAHLGEMFYKLRDADELIYEESTIAKKSLVVTSMEGDLDELTIYLSAIVSVSQGTNVHYLGPNMSPQPLVEVTSALGADVILLGNSWQPPGTLIRTKTDYLQVLDQSLPPGCEVWLVGGAKNEVGNDQMSRPIAKLRDIRELEQHITLQLNSFSS